MRMARDMREQFRQLLRDGGLLGRSVGVQRQQQQQQEYHRQQPDTHKDEWELVKAVLVAGLYPNVARVDPGKHRFKTKFVTRDNGKVQLHPGA